MTDKEKIVAAIRLLIGEGYSVTYELPPIGKAGLGVHLHATDEDVNTIRLSNVDYTQLIKAIEGETE